MLDAVADEISADTENIGSEAQMGFKSSPAFPYLRESFLNDVVRRIDVTRVVQRVPEDDWLVSFEECAKGFYVGVSDSCEQLCICCGVVHGSELKNRMWDYRMQDKSSVRELQQYSCYPADSYFRESKIFDAVIGVSRRIIVVHAAARVQRTERSKT